MVNASLTCVLCVCVCVYMWTRTYLEVKEGPQPFYLDERESFELTRQARKSLFTYHLVAALLLRPLRAGGRRMWSLNEMPCWPSPQARVTLPLSKVFPPNKDLYPTLSSCTSATRN